MAVLMLLCSPAVRAQSVRYNYDSSKKNQITVMETGSGSLSPELYYTLLHNSYKKTAAQKNKLGYRTLAGINLYNQVEDAEAIDSALTQRARIEALNVADRTVDVAWLAEGSKITSKMESFQKNIDRIVVAGGTIEDRNRWKEYYNVFQCAINVTKDSYMPNVQRKKRYLDIYQNVAKQNDILLKQLVVYNNAVKTKDLLLNTQEKPEVNKQSVVLSSKNRWKSNLSKSSSNGGGNGGNTVEE